MRVLPWLLLATVLLVLGAFPSVADFIGGGLWLALGVALRGVRAVLEQPSVQVIFGLGMLVRLARRRAV